MIKIEKMMGPGSFRLLRNDVEVLSTSKILILFGPTQSNYNGQKINISRKNPLSRRFQITKRGHVWGEIITARGGSANFRLKRADGEGEDVFILHSKGIIFENFTLEQSGKGPVLQMKSKKQILKNKTHFMVTEAKHGLSDDAVNELLIYCGFCAYKHIGYKNSGA